MTGHPRLSERPGGQRKPPDQLSPRPPSRTGRCPTAESQVAWDQGTVAPLLQSLPLPRGFARNHVTTTSVQDGPCSRRPPQTRLGFGRGGRRVAGARHRERMGLCKHGLDTWGLSKGPAWPHHPLREITLDRSPGGSWPLQALCLSFPTPVHLTRRHHNKTGQRSTSWRDVLCVPLPPAVSPGSGRGRRPGPTSASPAVGTGTAHPQAWASRT